MKSFASIEDLCLMDQLNELDNLKMDLRKILVDCIDRDRKGISKISDFLMVVAKPRRWSVMTSVG